jgi:hypothetical protein
MSGKKASAVILLLASVLGTSHGTDALALPVNDTVPDVRFPVPRGVVHQLFYLQRNSNTNTVVYQLNLDEGGHVNRKEPVHVFWIRYEEGGEPRELSFIQRRFAYGLKVRQTSPDSYELRFVSYTKFPLYLTRQAGEDRYRVYVTIGRRRAVLHRIYLRIEGGSFWMPNVKYVELRGVDAATGADLVERVKV